MHPLKPTLKTEWPSLLLIILAALLGIYLQSHLPARVPSHWNLAGEVDGYSSRSFGAWFMPALAAGMYLLLLFVPYLDPKRERYGEFRKAYAANTDFVSRFYGFNRRFIRSGGARKGCRRGNLYAGLSWSAACRNR